MNRYRSTSDIAIVAMGIMAVAGMIHVSMDYGAHGDVVIINTPTDDYPPRMPDPSCLKLDLETIENRRRRKQEREWWRGRGRGNARR